ncbi:MAG: hypothetical protein ABR579_08615 [Actinomycetota bacterium]
MSDTPTSNVEAVGAFLRGQNLEQLGRMDEAAALYEAIIQTNFDSSGPYDRLIAIYSDRADHAGVQRVAEAAVSHVRTHEQKLKWYEDVRAGAEEAARKVPPAIPKDK